MKTSTSTFGVWLLFGVGLLISPGAQAQNLIQNGGFENGFTGWNGTLGIYNAPMNPPPLTGSHVAILDGGQNPMFQSFSTVPGLTYEVKWGQRLPDLDQDGIPVVGDSTTGPGALTINLNGTFLTDSVQNRVTWGFYTVDFVATGTTSQLALSVPQYILVNNQLQRSASVFIDNVSAVLVPEPSAAVMLLAGLLFLGQFTKRRGKSGK
jgi:hypothetical protein